MTNSLERCRYCGMGFVNNNEQDVKDHKKCHERKILAERVFGHIATYEEREYLKDKVHKNNKGEYVEEYCLGGKELLYYAHWSRSIEACGYDLKHPSLQEYTLMRNLNSDLLNGSYVNMKKYKQYLHEEKIKNKQFKEVICIKSGVLVDIKNNVYNIDKNNVYAVISDNNGSQIFLADKNDDITICYLHGFSIDTLISDSYMSDNDYSVDDFALFKFI